MNKEEEKYVQHKIVEMLQFIINDVVMLKPTGKVIIDTPVFDFIEAIKNCSEDELEPMNTVLLSVRYHLKDSKKESKEELHLIAGDKYDIPNEKGEIIHHTDYAKLVAYYDMGKREVKLPIVYFLPSDALSICQAIGDWYTKYNENNTNALKEQGCIVEITQGIS